MSQSSAIWFVRSSDIALSPVLLLESLPQTPSAVPRAIGVRQPRASGPAVRARDDMFQATDTPWAPSHPSTKPGQVHTSILRPSLAGYCIVLLVLFGNVARGAVRYS